ncbi:chaperone protein dnaJ 11, chloroplastic-like [Punica granatum]|uniref:J domain-containing protein n=2 Tax=Punica granatum TaxID=22663 RepID=A0A218X602_PUNGR|nr:chaperone protein dnaJ 11, chloroplastic-like [Punica granatum]OWM80387.1 hypothetical protein CDL15_Pgr019667 [Punica granatum]PKI52893.1 hypothetical protein CRG98_026724 [Punica granatum]
MVALSPSFLQLPSIHSKTSQKPNKTTPPSSSSSSKHPRLRVSASYATTQHTTFQVAMSGSSLYEVLGISASATFNEIKAAYRRLARVCHPDVVAINKRENSASEFMRIHEAYSTLSDPDKRATYDRDLYGHAQAFSSLNSAMMAATAASMNMSSPSPFSGFSGKRWESDQCW